MGRKRVNKYPIAFRQMALERMKNCASVSALAEDLGVHRTVLYHWQRQLLAGMMALRPRQYEGFARKSGI